MKYNPAFTTPELLTFQAPRTIPDAAIIEATIQGHVDRGWQYVEAIDYGGGEVLVRMERPWRRP